MNEILIFIVSHSVNVAMPGVFALSEILLLFTLWTTTNGEAQVTVGGPNTCVLSGNNVSCWGQGMSSPQKHVRTLTMSVQFTLKLVSHTLSLDDFER